MYTVDPNRPAGQPPVSGPKRALLSPSGPARIRLSVRNPAERLSAGGHAVWFGSLLRTIRLHASG